MSDNVAIFIAGAGGMAGAGMFGPSPLNAYVDEFQKRYPSVPSVTLDWNSQTRIHDLIYTKRVVGLWHSFGVQRGFHQLFSSGNICETVDIVACDGVRYAKDDFFDVEGPITSDPFVQKFDRAPFPVPGWVNQCTSFLRAGGQSLFSYPESSPIVTDASRPDWRNEIVDVPGTFDLAKHADICGMPVVADTFWAMCERVFGAVV